MHPLHVDAVCTLEIFACENLNTTYSSKWLNNPDVVQSKSYRITLQSAEIERSFSAKEPYMYWCDGYMKINADHYHLKSPTGVIVVRAIIARRHRCCGVRPHCVKTCRWWYACCLGGLTSCMCPLRQSNTWVYFLHTSFKYVSRHIHMSIKDIYNSHVLHFNSWYWYIFQPYFMLKAYMYTLTALQKSNTWSGKCRTSCSAWSRRPWHGDCWTANTSSRVSKQVLWTGWIILWVGKDEH